MANQQTRSLERRHKGTRANRLPGGGAPTIIERPFFHGAACDTSFANAPGNGCKRKHAHRYKADEHMGQKKQAELCGMAYRKAA